MTDACEPNCEPNEEQALLGRLYAAVGEADEGEPVSESLLRERREKAAQEAREHE